MHSDQWIEQGGYVPVNSSTTFLKPYLDLKYTLVASGVTTSQNAPKYCQLMPNAYTKTGFTGATLSGVYLKWYTCGY